MSDNGSTPYNTTTPRLGLNKPLTGGDFDVWGDLLNTNADTLDQAVRASGDTMTGALTLQGDPSLPLQATTKQYTDAVRAAIPAASTLAPLMDSAATIGTSLTWARADHIHPSDTSRLTQAQTDARYLQLTGGALSGPLSLAADPTTAPGAATKNYVDTQLQNKPPLTVADTPPASPQPGWLWWDSVGAQLYLFYYDGNGPAQWVPAINQSGAVTEAPTDGAIYGRRNSAWANIITTPQVQTNVGRSFIHNGLFNIWQRGYGSFNASGLTADRWEFNLGLDTSSVSGQALSDGNRAQIGDEAAQIAPSIAVAGNAGAGSYTILCQKIEGLRRLSGKTVTVSFWATASVANMKLGVSIDQLPGSGGSPSATVLGNGQSVTLSNTTFTRYSLTFTLSSASGWTLGTNNDNNTRLNFWLSAGSSFATRSGSVGVQTGNVWIWGVQLEIGSQPTPLEKLDPRYDLANCQRFYTILNRVQFGGYITSGVIAYCALPLPSSMRAAPTIAFASPSYSGCAGVAATQSQPTAISIYATGNGSGQCWCVTDVIASADL